MRILFVAFPNSIHTVRWIRQLAETGWDMHLFPSNGMQAPHPQLSGVTLHGYGFMAPLEYSDVDVDFAGKWPFEKGAYRMEKLRRSFAQDTCERQLAVLIERLKPDVLHTLEMQHSAYLALDSIRMLDERNVPPWLYSSWGSDIAFFGQQETHVPRIRDVLGRCTHYIADCQRDVALVRRFGFEGEIMGVFPAIGGIDLAHFSALCSDIPASKRTAIAVKGYHSDDWAGRALVGLRAIELSAEAVRAHEIGLYLQSASVEHAADYIRRNTGLRFSFVPPGPHPDEVARLMGRSRLSLALSVSDGTPASLLESMTMGAFPVQSNVGGASDWIRDGENGFLVDPEDPNSVAKAIQKAMSDDELVNNAQKTNRTLIKEHLSAEVQRPRIINAYEQVVCRR